MKSQIWVGVVVAATLALACPLTAMAIPSGGNAPALDAAAVADTNPETPSAGSAAPTAPTRAVAAPAAPTVDPTQTPAPTATAPAAASAPAAPAATAVRVTAVNLVAPSTVSAGGVQGTTSADLTSFAQAYNGVRVANGLAALPAGNFRYDACLEERLFWMAEDPSEDPASAWGHIGSVRSDGLPSVGCDGNLAGGTNNTGAVVAQKFWDSSDHRISLYKPAFTGSTDTVCIHFAMTHGGVPDESIQFTRSSALWGGC